ncbi:E3 ubiquitin-protein ligase RNF4-like [Drosophila eugracilis]|uniref:E3 ubiquitin-protein ligase RNF4-like n=1 Tax=Drosophila eugracilis TaxID=29029 RepID=UPI0007E8A02E|nr:E3 ubiquitin-protein ligase RNF4-like [Drosophila eugracilis]
MKPKSKDNKPSNLEAALSFIMKKNRDDLGGKPRQAAARMEKTPSPGPSGSKKPAKHGFWKDKRDNDRDRQMYMNSITMINDGLRERIEQAEKTKNALMESNAILKLEIEDLTQKKTELDQILRENTCSICLLGWHLYSGHYPMSLKCGHVFGSKCILQHLECRFGCPTCRKPVHFRSLRGLHCS